MKGDVKMAKYRKKPVEIEAFQYDGDLIYSNGKYLAFNLEYDEIPSSINGDDVDCHSFWIENEDYLVGKGNSIDKAIEDLCYKLNKIERED